MKAFHSFWQCRQPFLKNNSPAIRLKQIKCFITLCFYTFYTSFTYIVLKYYLDLHQTSSPRDASLLKFYECFLSTCLKMKDEYL